MRGIIFCLLDRLRWLSKLVLLALGLSMEQGDESLGLGRDAELPEAVSLGLVTFGSAFVKTGTNDLGKEKWPVNFGTASCQSLMFSLRTKQSKA